MARSVGKTIKDIENETSVAAKPQRELVVETDEHGLYFARMGGGGKIPDSLQGKFTSINTVNNLIRLYESRNG